MAERQRVEQLEQQVERDTAELQRTSMALHRLEAEEGEREAAAQVAQLCATRLSKNPPAVRAASAAGSAVAAARTMRTHDAGEVGGGEVADEVEDNEEEEEEEGGALAMATLRQAEAEEAARDAALMRGERPPAALDEAHDAPPTAELSGAVALADAGRALVLSVDAHTSQEVAEALHQALPPAPTPPPRAARAAPTRPLSGRVSLRPAPAEALRSRSHHSPSRSKAQAHAGAPGAGRPEAARVPAHWPPGIAAADARPISAPSDYIAGVKPRLHGACSRARSALDATHARTLRSAQLPCRHWRGAGTCRRSGTLRLFLLMHLCSLACPCRCGDGPPALACACGRWARTRCLLLPARPPSSPQTTL